MKKRLVAVLALTTTLVSAPAFAADVDATIGMIWADPSGAFFFQQSSGANWCSGGGGFNSFVHVSTGRSGITSQDAVKNYLSLITAAKLAGKTVRVVNVRSNPAGHCDFDALVVL